MVRILVVEDDRELNRVVCAFLRQQGFDAVGCLSANEAYDILYESSVALIRWIFFCGYGTGDG